MSKKPKGRDPPADSPPDALTKWARWWQRFPDRARLATATPGELLEILTFLLSLPLLARGQPKPWTEIWCFGYRAVEALTLAAARRGMDALAIEALWPVIVGHLEKALEVSERRGAEALASGQGYVVFTSLDDLEFHLPPDRLRDHERAALRKGLRELKALSLRLEVEQAEGPKASKAEAVDARKVAKSRRARPRLDKRGRRVSDGKCWHDVTDEQYQMFEVLFEANGAWVQGPNLSKRPDKRCAGMHPNLQRLIETHQRDGYRIPALLSR